MNSKDPVSHPALSQTRQPSATLVSAALVGLLGMTSCSSSSSDDNAAAATPTVTSKTKDETMTLAKFSEDCDTRKGLLQTHAACSGNNACKGISFNKFSKTIVEHTCKGTNTCGGVSCVEPAADQGLTGEAVYKASCADCHSSMEGGDESTFKLFVKKGGDLAAAEAAFTTKDAAIQVSYVAFGINGTDTSTGDSFANMPGFHSKYSRAEIEKVVEHVRGLTPKAEEYDPTSDE